MKGERGDMAKKPEFKPPIRVIALLVGIMIGCILSYAYKVNMPTLFYKTYVCASFVVFVTIPVLAGFVGALIRPDGAVKDGLYVGFFSGLFNSVITTLKLIYTPVLTPGEVYAFSVFAAISVFTWMILAATDACWHKNFMNS